MDSDWFRQELERKVREQVQHALGIEPAVPVFVDAPEPTAASSLTLQTLLDAKALIASNEPTFHQLEFLRSLEYTPARVHAFGYWTGPAHRYPFIPAVSARDLEEMAEVELALDHLQQQGTKFYTRAGKRKLDRTMSFVGRRR